MIIAQYVLIKCDQEHGKHTVEKFSYVSRTPSRSCAICLDATQGLFDWEVALHADTNIPRSPLIDRLLMAANVRNMALQVASKPLVRRELVEA